MYDIIYDIYIYIYLIQFLHSSARVVVRCNHLTTAMVPPTDYTHGNSPTGFPALGGVAMVAYRGR